MITCRRDRAEFRDRHDVDLAGARCGALLDLLVKKKLITDQEAEEVRAELAKDVSTTAAGKWKLSLPITELELYGDARLRYDLRNGENLSDDTLQRSRERYRLRLGLRGTLADDWFSASVWKRARIHAQAT